MGKTCVHLKKKGMWFTEINHDKNHKVNEVEDGVWWGDHHVTGAIRATNQAAKNAKAPASKTNTGTPKSDREDNQEVKEERERKRDTYTIDYVYEKQWQKEET